MRDKFKPLIVVVFVLSLLIANSTLATKSVHKYMPANKGKTIQEKDYSKHVIFNTSDFIQPGHLLQTVTVQPNTKVRTHWHNKQTDVYYVLEGEGLLILDGKKYIAKPGDAFIVNPGVKHMVWNKSNVPFVRAVFKIDYPENDSTDTVWINE